MFYNRHFLFLNDSFKGYHYIEIVKNKNLNKSSYATMNYNSLFIEKNFFSSFFFNSITVKIDNSISSMFSDRQNIFFFLSAQISFISVVVYPHYMLYFSSHNRVFFHRCLVHFLR